MIRLNVSDLPEFLRPPVVEVVLAVQAAGAAFSEPRFDGAWSDILSRFPNIRAQPALPPIREEFGPPAVGAFSALQLFALPGMLYVLSSDDGRRLVQVQPDRIAVNWRKAQADDEYPRYRVLVDEFERTLLLLSTAAPNGDGARYDWVEVTYVNHVETAEATDAHRFPGRVLVGLEPVTSPAPLLALDDYQFACRYVIGDGEAEPLGRLNVQATTAIRNADGQPIVVLTLTARVRVADGHVRGALDRAHEAIVRSFRAVTPADMHEAWGIVR